MSTHLSAAAELNWSTGSHSAGDGGECVEVATTVSAVLVRDSKDLSRPHLAVTPARWAHLVRYAAGTLRPPASQGARDHV
ncbi:DUF397 domain-containing protein [Streptomyces sp. NBC_01460]|uniref:DUF397 domain-containing protein n=1 Tax=Streptomyces sp. NBC_01460 TaxID=2903875 RepID=UPI002E3284EF|nr:DUF397 domain-containing protein [Streptomyces sp. NBC_01460]